MIKRFPNLIIANAILFFAISADAQFGVSPRVVLQPMSSAVDLIKKQAPLRVNQALLAKISPGRRAHHCFAGETACLPDGRARNRG